MGRIIIYALGAFFQKHQEEIDWQEVIAVSDKNIGGISEYHGVPFIKPEQIANQTYDYVVIFSPRLYKEIKYQLKGYYFVPEEKILPYEALIQAKLCTEEQIIEYYKEIVREFQFHSILDVGMPFFQKYYYTTEEIFPDYSLLMDGVGNKAYLIGENLYQTIYASIDECMGKYEIAILWNYVDNIEQSIHKLQNCVRYILFHVFYSTKEIGEIERIDKILRKYPVKKRLAVTDGIFWLVDISSSVVVEDITIYVVTHKAYQVQHNDLYQPICVGDAYKNSSYLSEKTGDNISYLNEKINECTALYWIWKNTDTKYVGLNHYRRYFYNNRIRNAGNYLDKETACKYLQKYDIILTMAEPLFNRTVLDHVRGPMDNELCMRALKLLRESVERHQPDYLGVFDYVVYGHKVYLCNMFVTQREILNAYCEWLFSFLIEATEKFDINGYEAYDKRAMGFWAERMLSVWMLKQDLKVKELPYVIIRDSGNGLVALGE